jgi:hypothetical protein
LTFVYFGRNDIRVAADPTVNKITSPSKLPAPVPRTYEIPIPSAALLAGCLRRHAYDASCTACLGRCTMDIAYLLGIVVFFALTAALAVGCAKLGGAK